MRRTTTACLVVCHLPHRDVLHPRHAVDEGGKRKAIHQLPWYRNGVFAGFVELAIPIGDQLPHFDRD
jgi:hypothetical protein